MILNPYSLRTNIFVTVMVIVMIVVLPTADIAVCRALKVDPRGEKSGRKDARRLLILRKALLIAAFAVYLGIFANLVFFSRHASEEYRIQMKLFPQIKNSFDADLGFIDLLAVILRDGFEEGMAHIKVFNPMGLAEPYMNVMLFVPMGYLLPYIFPWFRGKVRVRPALACAIMSLAVENIQLITRHGYYDIDDLITNSLGGLIGQWAFIAAGYAITHPDWRSEIRHYRKWRRHAEKSTILPFIGGGGVCRFHLTGTDAEQLRDFYENRLGLRCKQSMIHTDRGGTYLLFEVKGIQIEFFVPDSPAETPPGRITLPVRRIASAAKRLKAGGIDCTAICPDPYTQRPCLSLKAPDNVTIELIGR